MISAVEAGQKMSQGKHHGHPIPNPGHINTWSLLTWGRRGRPGNPEEVDSIPKGRSLSGGQDRTQGCLDSHQGVGLSFRVQTTTGLALLPSRDSGAKARLPQRLLTYSPSLPCLRCQSTGP